MQILVSQALSDLQVTSICKLIMGITISHSYRCSEGKCWALLCYGQQRHGKEQAWNLHWLARICN